MECLTLTDWSAKHGSSIKFKHNMYGEDVFEGVIRGSTVGKVLVEMSENTEPYVWFLKNEIEIL